MKDAVPNSDRNSESKAGHIFDVIILGGGAAGLMCAAVAGRRGRRVLVLEKSNKVGKKILMSGGGRCNFTNLDVEADNYISANPHFCKSALKLFSQWDFIDLVSRYGLEFEERKHGQLFCVHAAKDILKILLSECELGGVKIRTRCAVQTVAALAVAGSTGHQEGDDSGLRYCVDCGFGDEQQRFSARSLVVATGALSLPTLGGSGFGYALAEHFDLPLVERRAGLVPFMFTDAMKPICERLSGLAVAVSIRCGNHCFTENILFTHRGLSGPAVLQISNYWHPGDDVVIDLLPDIDATGFLLSTKKQLGKRLLKSVLLEHLAKPLVRELQDLWWPDSADTALAEISDNQLQTIAEQLKNWSLKPSSTEGYRTAEVTLGRVDTDNLNSKSMEVKHQPGLFFIGEVVDVSGHLGGFNFQWAWSSGYCAGMSV